jgi:hypothetical protein
LTDAPSRVILPLIMAAMLHLDFPRTCCADLGIAKRNPSQVEVQSK